MLKENIDFIRKFDVKLLDILVKENVNSSIGVISSKVGLPTLQVQKDNGLILLHSKYNPIQEAKRILDSLQDIDKYEHIIFYGNGFGYLTEELLKRHPHKRFSIIEPSKEVFSLYLKESEFTKLPLNQLSFLKVGLTEDETQSFIKEFFHHVREKTLLVTMPSYERFIPQEYARFLQDFKKEIKASRKDINVNYSFQKRWTLNSWINLPETLRTPNILQDIDKVFFEKKPVIIAAAGPSLNEELENLRIIQEKGLAYIFSVGSAINTLIENDIYPNAMCTYDPTQLNQVVFQKVIEKEISTIPMIYGTSVGYETLKNYHGPKLHMVTTQDTISNYYLKRIDEHDINKVQDAPSIAVVALELLNLLGCTPLILVGQNLAYKNKQIYSKDMGYEHISNMLSPDEIKKAIPVKSVEGNEVLSEEGFISMRSQIEYYLSNMMRDAEVINTTIGGAHIEGTTFEYLTNIMKERLQDKSTVEKWFENEGNFYDFIFLEEQLKKMESEHLALEESLRRVKRLFNKMEQLVTERKVVKLEKMFSKFDIEMKYFVQNDYYITFLQPMSRVEFDILTRDINSLKFDKDIISKAKKTINSFKRFVNSCEFDIKNMKPVFEQVNKELREFLKERREKDAE